ncbi:MAG TPA: gliding motility-associated C-terminal domain-containing protein [Chitinophagales bacterium]|nr:gliding motility-associated C-terminal domain-containing protein [Chitinophagales bacterium]
MRILYFHRIALSIICVLGLSAVKAQPGCPDVNAGSDVSLPCGTNCANLTATAFQTGATTDYTASSIPYAPPFPFTGGTQIIIQTDDIFSDVITLPFTFCFYGNSYTQAVIGANGLISFDLAEANQWCEYTFSASIPTPGPPSGGIYNNSINGAYHDMDPSVSTLVTLFPPTFNYPANINYAVLGTAPCRTFVVNFSTVPHYNCNSLRTTQQIVLYETTNVIEVYIKDKPTCSTWNNGNAVIGIQNSDGSLGVAAPGRNTGDWSASNEAWRFTPNGPSIVALSWFQGATQIGSGSTISVCPGSNTTYTAQAVYTPCAGGVPVVVTDDVTVTLAGALQAGIDSSHDVTCFGGNNGEAFAHASTTNAGLTYGWADGATTLTRTGLAPGTYIFTATDASNCVRADTVTINQPTQVTANVPNASQTNCAGTGTGVLVAGRAGGTGPYTFVWSSSPVQNDSILDNVAAGTYTVTVTDSKGCTAQASGTLTINTGGNNVTLGSPVITQPLCNGGNNGSIAANATGGSGAYNYVWSNAQTTATATGLTQGQYSVTVDDGAGCTAAGTYNVGEPTPLVIDPANITNIGCGGAAAGAITANASGATPNYTFSWIQQSTNQALSGQTINNLGVDNYNLTVTDVNGCSATAAYTITSVPALTFTQSQTEVSCAGGSNGTATITITTGTAPYSYDWNSNGPTANATLTGISAGVVNVTVADLNCTATATFTITEPTPVTISTINQTDVSCFGGNDGAVTVAASGGTPGTSTTPYTYLWNTTPAQTNATATGLAAAPVTVIAADANNCTASQTYTPVQPAELTASANATDATCFMAPNGSVVANATGGQLPYSYLWSDSQTTKLAMGLVAGTYTVVVTDGSGCTATASDVVSEPSDLLIATSSTPVKCVGEANGTITVAANGGVSPYTYVATPDGANFIYPTDSVILGLAIGTYTVIVSDSFGCTKTVQAVVPNATLDNFTTSTDSTSCYGTDYNDGGAHVISTTPFNGPYTYSIDNGIGQYSGDFYNISAGDHIITATSYNNCVTTIPVLVLEPLPIVVDVVPDTVRLPLGQGQQVQVTYINANAPVTYAWTPELGLSCTDCPNPTVNPFTEQDYVITVSMVNGSATCYGSATLHAEVTKPLPVFVPNSFSPNGDGNNDVFQIYGQSIKSIDLKIFNRWGELVYESNNQFGGWDGTYKGQMQLPSVFTYATKVVFLDDTKTSLKGTVTLLR